MTRESSRTTVAMDRMAAERRRDELVANLQALHHTDPEQGHMDADKLLLAYIGDPFVTEAFEAVPKWYG